MTSEEKEGLQREAVFPGSHSLQEVTGGFEPRSSGSWTSWVCEEITGGKDQPDPTQVLLPCLLRNLYAGQEATVRTAHGTTDWFQIGKGVRQACILSPRLFNSYAEYITRNAGLEETQAGIKIAWEKYQLPQICR